tara:strand:- start:413 stop:4411 length:3999 start_codon:yes stop_codon:yes gene_type:complete
MRTLSASQTSILQSANRSVHVRVRIDTSTGAYDTNGDGGPYNGNFTNTNRQISGTVTTSSNVSLSGSSTKFTRELSVGSVIELNDAGGLKTTIASITNDTTATMVDAAASGESGRTLRIRSGSQIVDLSDYQGYNWIKSVDYGGDIDSNGLDAEIELHRRIDNLTLVPLITSSPTNKDAQGHTIAPVDINRKLIIEVAVLPMDQITPLTTDYNEVFRGYIDEIDWGSDTITVKCRDLAAKYQDFLIYQHNLTSTAGDPILYGNDTSSVNLSGTFTVEKATFGDKGVTLAGAGSNDVHNELNVGDTIAIQLSSSAAIEECQGKEYTTQVIGLGSPAWAGSGIDLVYTGTAQNVFFEPKLPSSDTGTVTARKLTRSTLGLHAIVQNLLSSQNDGFDYTASTSTAVYSYGNIDHYLYTPSGDSSSLPNSSFEATASTTGTVTVPASGGATPNTIVGSSTKFTTELYAGAQIGIAYSGGTFNTIVDTITSDTSLTVQDISPVGSAEAGKTFTLDERPGFIPNSTIDALDQTLMDMCVKFAEEIGWTFSFKWNDNVTTTFGSQGGAVDATQNGAFVPMLTCPKRDRVTSNVDFTFSPSVYYDITSASVSQARIRNNVRVHYSERYFTGNEIETHNENFVDVSDTDSIAKYGKRSVRIGGTGGSLGLINSLEEARRLGKALIADLKDPEMIQEIEVPFFWPVENGDYYKFEANSDHYDTDQFLAVYGFRHLINEDSATTEMTCRGKPAGYLNRWETMRSAFPFDSGAPVLSLTTGSAQGVDYSIPGTFTLTENASNRRVFATSTASRDAITQIPPGRQVTISYNSGSSTHTSLVTATIDTVFSDSENILGGTTDNTEAIVLLDKVNPSGSSTFTDATVIVKGGGSILTAGTDVTLNTSNPSPGIEDRTYSYFYMSTSRDIFEEDSVGVPHIAFQEGGYYIGETPGTSMTVSGLEPGQTYYFCSRFRVFANAPSQPVPGVSFISDHGTYSGWSNVVEFTPTGTNAGHMDTNHSDMVQYNRYGDIGSWFERITNPSNAAPSSRPPAGWNMVTGAWTLDFQRELSTVNTGIAAIKSPSGETATAAIETSLFPVPADGVVRAISSIRTDNTGARFTMKLHEYQADQTTENGSGTELLADGQAYLQTADSWIELSKGISLASTTKWCKFKFLRSNNTGNVYINDARLLNSVPSFRAAYDTASSALASGASATIVYDDASNAPNFDLGGNYNPSGGSAGKFIVPRDGIYEFEAQLSVTHSAPTNTTTLSYYQSTLEILAGGSAVAVAFGDMLFARTYTQFRVETGPLSLSKGDEVFVKLVNSSGKDMTPQTTTGHGYFTGKQID